MTKTSEKTLRNVWVGGGMILFEVQKPSEINRKKFKNWRYKGKKLGDFRFTVHTQESVAQIQSKFCKFKADFGLPASDCREGLARVISSAPLDTPANTSTVIVSPVVAVFQREMSQKYRDTCYPASSIYSLRRHSVPGTP